MTEDEKWTMAVTSHGKELMVFDWAKAAELIRDRRPKYASAGLRFDWDEVGGCIWEKGLPVDSEYTFLASTWATPELDLDGEIVECYQMKSDLPMWDCYTKWPNEALIILGLPTDYFSKDNKLNA